MLIMDAKNLLDSFVSWTAGYVRREANGAAHLLAKDAILLEKYRANFECNHVCNLANMDDVILL